MKNFIILSCVFLLVMSINQIGKTQQKNCNGPFDVDLSDNTTHTFDDVLSQLGIATLQEFNDLKRQFDMVIGGTLQLDKPNQEIAFYGTRIKMLGNARIEVRNTTTLTLDNAHIYGCGTMWRNIDVLNGTIKTRNDCTIEDATFAINAPINSKIDLQSTHFKNNLYGVSIGGTGATNIQVSVSDCSFYSDNGFLSTNPIVVGISVVGLDYIDLSPESGERNTFSNLHNGIVGVSASIRVKDSDFQNITVSYVLEDPNAWQNGGYGIFLSGSRSNSMTQITDNTFYAMHTAIRSNKANINVRDNIISSQTGISLENVDRFWLSNNNIIASVAGIQLNSCNRAGRSFHIYDNMIDMPYSGKAIDVQLSDELEIRLNDIKINEQAKAGIFSRESHGVIVDDNYLVVGGSTDFENTGIHLESSNYVDVTDNDLEKLDYAICCFPLSTGIYSENSFGHYSCNKIYGENEYVGFTKSGMEFLHMCDNSRLSGNDWKSGVKNLVLGSEDYNVPTIIGTQGDFTSLKGWGNKWTGMSGGSAYNYSEFAINYSHFLVNASSNPDYLPATIFPSANWFYNNALVTNESPCADPNNGNNSPIYDCTDLINKITMIDTTRKFDACQKAIWKYHYFKKLLRMKKLNQLSPGCLSFLNAYNNDALVKIAKVDSAITHILINQAADSLLYEHIMSTQSELNTLHDQGLVFTPQYQQYMTLYSQLLADHRVLLETERNKDLLKVDSVKNVITTITVRDHCLQLLLNIFNVQLDYIKSDTLTPAQIAYVTDVSEMCPYDMGEAVYLARSIRSIVENVSYDRIEDCAPARVTPRSSEKMYSENKMFLYPNPVSDELNIAFEAKPNEKGDITITDMNGRLVKQFKLEETDHSLKLSVSNFNSGLYIVKYMSLSGVEHIEKFVISK